MLDSDDLDDADDELLELEAGLDLFVLVRWYWAGNAAAAAAAAWAAFTNADFSFVDDEDDEELMLIDDRDLNEAIRNQFVLYIALRTEATVQRES